MINEEDLKLELKAVQEDIEFLGSLREPLEKEKELLRHKEYKLLNVIRSLEQLRLERAFHD